MIGSIVSGIINAQDSLPTTDLSALFSQIDAAGEQKKILINNLPAELKKKYDEYQASLSKAGTDLKTSTTDIGQNLLDKTKALYDPNSAAVQATLAALKQQDYSTLPGTLTNLKAQLAATGGLSTGGAGRAITQAVLDPAARYSQQAADVQANQLNLQQTNTQSALNKIAQMDEATAQSLFGMSTAEASTILQFGRSDLKEQLSGLINNIDTVSNQKLGLLGYQANQGLQNAITRNAQSASIMNDFGSTLDNVITYGGSSLTNSDGSTGFNPNTMSNPNAANANIGRPKTSSRPVYDGLTSPSYNIG